MDNIILHSGEKMKKICRIFAAGDFSSDDLTNTKDAFIIVADAGLKKLKMTELKPDLLVGDFDSLGDEFVISEGTEIVRFPPEKDDTDMMMCVKEGFKRGFDEFEIYGGLGGSRIDHTIANIQILSYISKRGAIAYMTSGNTSLTAISDGIIEFGADLSGMFSVFSLDSASREVTITGAKYPIELPATLTNSYPFGVSNEFCGSKTTISVKSGTLLIVWSQPLKKESPVRQYYLI